MIFAELPVVEAEGALLAHSIRVHGTAFRKGRRLSTADIAALSAIGQTTVAAVRLEPGDVTEDEAARQVAEAVCGEHLSVAAAFTGRCNLIAELPGLLVVDREHLDAVNLVDELITIATLAPFDLLAKGDMAATIKIIPFAVPGEVLDRCLALARLGKPILRLATMQPRRVALISDAASGHQGQRARQDTGGDQPAPCRAAMPASDRAPMRPSQR